MPQQCSIALSPADAADESRVRAFAAVELAISEDQITSVRILRRSIDARSRSVKVLLKLEVFLDGEIPPDDPLGGAGAAHHAYPSVSDKEPVIIIGAGPAGLFAALKLIAVGLESPANARKPIILERGKDVRARRRDLAAIHKEHIVNPDSNYCFGEGGAGTYSDGKLYTRSDKRGDVRRVLETLVAHGASPDILIDAHPHIGTNNLPRIITNIRQTILDAGGEIHFNSRVVDLILDGNPADRIRGVVTANGDRIEANAVILATGHSARDIFELLHRKGILIEAKPFALGVRIEHPQELIDEIQYKCSPRDPLLPPASYALVDQVRGKGVYSFCMCPGGIIAPCATKPGEIVTNGWSPSKRNNPFANSGIVCQVDLEDVKGFSSAGPLAFLRFQQHIEQLAWKAASSQPVGTAGGAHHANENEVDRVAGGLRAAQTPDSKPTIVGQTAPAQRMIDFVSNKVSSDLPKNSYQPGLASVSLRDVLPKFITTRLQEAFRDFGNKMRGYYTNEAVLVAPESRTSSPVRIPRDMETLEHPQIAGLYPCGEGGGYAGGIVSAAMDGERVAGRICSR